MLLFNNQEQTESLFVLSEDMPVLSTQSILQYCDIVMVVQMHLLADPRYSVLRVLWLLLASCALLLYPAILV